MTREDAIDLLDNLIGMVDDNHDNDYDTALKMGIQALEYDDAKYHEEHGEVIVDKAVWEDAKRALEQEPSGDAVSRQAVEDKLLKLCNEIEVIFANIRMQNVDESVCGLCEYDCPAPFECKGYYTDECFKLADEIRHKWQSTNDLPSVKPLEKMGHWIRITNGAMKEKYICSKCGRQIEDDGIEGLLPIKYPYCHCGCRMVEPQESEV